MPKPDLQGQGLLFEDMAPPDATTEAGMAFLPADFDPPATKLSEYYAALAGAVRAIGRARSNEDGFTQLSETSHPAREFAARLDTTPEEAIRTVGNTATRHYLRAQIILNKQSDKEASRLRKYADATGQFTQVEVSDATLPPSVFEVEFSYFTDPDRSQKALAKTRQQLYRKAKRLQQQS